MSWVMLTPDRFNVSDALTTAVDVIVSVEGGSVTVGTVMVLN